MIDFTLSFLANYMIECMVTLFFMALAFRWLTFRSLKKDSLSYVRFMRETEKVVEERKKGDTDANGTSPEKIVEELLEQIKNNLPSDDLRLFGPTKDHKENGKKDFYDKKILSLDDYMGSQKGLMHNILSEKNAFSSKFPPNFSELTDRILQQDERWIKLFKVIPINGISRFIDILPGIFIVLGILGTFVGISLALPEIGQIDFNNLDGSSETLTNFVKNVTFAMSSSIVGIICSLLMTILNTMLPVMREREDIAHNMEYSFELLWYSIQGGTNLERKMMQVLPQIRDYLKSLNEDLKNQRTKYTG